MHRIGASSHFLYFHLPKGHCLKRRAEEEKGRRKYIVGKARIDINHGPVPHAKVHASIPMSRDTNVHAPMDDGSRVSQAVELQLTSYLSPYFYSVGKGDIKLLLSRQFPSYRRAIRETRPRRGSD